MSHRYLLTALIVLGMLLVPLAIAPKVHALPVFCSALVTICWNNPSGGSWETVANWILPDGTLANRLPTASDDVVLPLIVDGISAYTVTISSVQTVNSILVSPTVTLNCASTCTLTIKSHTPVTFATIIGGGLMGVAGFTPAVTPPRADIYGTLKIDGNVVNDASLVDVGAGAAGVIHIDAGGTFVNVNSLDVSDGYLQNNGAFVEKCLSLLTPTPPGTSFGGSGTYLTESPCPTQVSTASGSQVSGIASFSSDLGGFTSLTATAVSSVSPAPPAELTFPAGLFSFTISGLQAGGTVTVTITLPSPLPAGQFSYYKFQSGVWTQYPASLDSTRTIITLTFTADASGTVTDPGGPAIIPAIVPEYPLGLPLLAIFIIITYGLIRRRTRDPQNI